MGLINWFRDLFKKKEKEVAPKPEEVGGGMKLDLNRVLTRLDEKTDVPNAVRANAIRTLTSMAGREITAAASTGDVKRAQQINDVLGNLETKFPKAVDSLSKEDKIALQHQKDRTAARVARMQNNLKNTAGEASSYGAVPNPKTVERRNRLNGK